MILIDDRYLSLRPRNWLGRFGGLAIETRLDHGDALFHNKDATRSVVIEVKAPLDILTCLEQTGRLIHQIQLAREAGCALYAVIVQGVKRTPDGMVGSLRRNGAQPVELIGGRTVPYRNLDNFLTSLELIEGILIKRSEDDAETAQIVEDLYHWWQKDLEDHKSIQAFHQPIHMTAQRHSLARRVAKELEGIGLERSRWVAEKFPTVYQMALAGEQEWQEIDGIGPVLSKKVVREIRGED